MDDRPLLSPRVYSGIAVIFGILGIVMIAWWIRGIAEATQLFELLQGVLLATITFLWGSHQIDRANARADDAAELKQAATGIATKASTRAEGFADELDELRRVLAALYADPSLRQKVEEIVRQVEQEDGP